MTGIRERVSAGVIGALGWMALLGQLYVTITLMTAQGHSVLYSVWRFLGYFTILTNLLVAVMFSCVALGRWPGGGRPSPSALTAGVMYITFVMLVYHLLLAGLYDLHGLQSLVDVMLHYVVPSLALIWWLAFAPKSGLSPVMEFSWLAYPLAYCAYALLRGSIEGWYPYPFIDAGQIGLGRSLVNAALLTLAFLLAGFLFLGVAKLRRRSA